MKPYLFTERAHLMCPNMCFGIAAATRVPFDEMKSREAFSALSEAHPFLRALLGHETENNAFYYDITEDSHVEILLKEGEVSAVDSPEVLEEYDRLTGYDWDLFSDGMLKAAVWKMGTGTCFLLVFHHLMTDGRGALGLMQELCDYYALGMVPHYAPEKLIASASDLPKGSGMPFLSRKLVDKANRDWAKEKHAPLSYEEYHEYANRYLQKDRVSHSVKKINSEKLSEVLDQCRAHSVTVNDFLMARMFRNEQTNKIIIASDLRDQLPVYTPGAMGNYSTAFSVETRKKNNDVFALAKEIHQKVQKTMDSPSRLYLVLQCYAALDPGILDAAFLAAQNAFDSKAAAFIGKMFFGFEAPTGCSITNLGRIESRSIDAAYFIPPASPAIRKTQGVLSVNGEMRICTSRR